MPATRAWGVVPRTPRVEGGPFVFRCDGCDRPDHPPTGKHTGAVVQMWLQLPLDEALVEEVLIA